MRNKLVTIFALYQDSLIVTQNLSSAYQFRKTGSGQFLQSGQHYLDMTTPAYLPGFNHTGA